jgi:superfamily II DNA or RNA helicase
VTYCGELAYSSGNWLIKAEPHILMKLKGVFGRVEKYKLGIVQVTHTPEICYDLKWFMQRYPFKTKHAELLECGAQLHAMTMEQMQSILLPDYTPTERKLSKPLRDYQAKCVDLYLSRQFLLCADTLGLGKSVEAIASFTDKRTLPAVIVCKSHLVRQWQDYCTEFMPEITTHIVKTQKQYALPSADVYLITYSKLFYWVETMGKLVKSMILDEVQEVRRFSSNKHQAAAEIRRKIDFCMGLSATPIYNYGARSGTS